MDGDGWVGKTGEKGEESGRESEWRERKREKWKGVKREEDTIARARKKKCGEKVYWRPLRLFYLGNTSLYNLTFSMLHERTVTVNIPVLSMTYLLSLVCDICLTVSCLR